MKLMMLLFIVLALFLSIRDKRVVVDRKSEKAYARGVNDALNGIELIELEQRALLQNATPEERLRVGNQIMVSELSRVVSKRLNVERVK
jgi:hypothetical protein